jgi:predicted nucleic acid-binding protein
MKVFFDSSVLVAAMSQGHPQHSASLLWARKASLGKIEAFMSTHTLAELYSVLTGHPAWRITPEDFVKSLKVLKGYVKPVALGLTDYECALERMASCGFSGGGIYDALHARAALKCKAEVLLSWNEKHFSRLGEDIATLVRTP